MLLMKIWKRENGIFKQLFLTRSFSWLRTSTAVILRFWTVAVFNILKATLINKSSLLPTNH